MNKLNEAALLSPVIKREYTAPKVTRFGRVRELTTGGTGTMIESNSMCGQGDVKKKC